jgi:hypothetical protein
VIDSRIVGNVLNNTQPAGGIPLSAPVPGEPKIVTDQIPGAVANPGDPPFQAITHGANWDTDADGMPNEWEKAHGLDPLSATGWNLDFDSDGYINLIEYINEVGEFPAPAPIVYVGPANGASARYALITNWKTNDGGVTAGTNWQPSRFDEAQINGGAVAVDAVGQHTGVLKIAANPGDNATLNVTGGWLKVKDNIIIAAAGATAALNLSGGTLRTTTLSKGSGGSLSFTGGKLSADTVNFSLANNGGTLAPGDSIGATETNSVAPNIGQTHVVGDLTLNSGTLQIELASLGSFDKLLVDGIATLGGNLAVSTLGGFVPANGNSWQIITAGGISLNFGSVTAGYTVQQQGNNLMLFFGTPTLAGDYNGDSIVNAGDYTTWRRAMAGGGTLLNETASIGVVDQADYDAWRANFGATNGPGSGAAAAIAAVPEPGIAMLFAWVGVSTFWLQQGRRDRKRRLRVSGTFLQE